MCCIVFIHLFKEITNAYKFIKFTSIITIMYIIKLNKMGQKQKAFKDLDGANILTGDFMVPHTIIVQNLTSKGGLQVKYTNKYYHFN